MSDSYSFDYMVGKLFKKGKMKEEGEELMHAAIGISGEVAELGSCISRLNILEELGDLAFYIEAARQSINFRGSDCATQYYTLASLLNIMSQLAGDLLDLTKKQWVYGKPIENEKIHQLLDQLLSGVIFLGELSGYTILDIMSANHEKLEKRYPGHVYSDQNAQVRLDKQGE